MNDFEYLLKPDLVEYSTLRKFTKSVFKLTILKIFGKYLSLTVRRWSGLLVTKYSDLNFYKGNHKIFITKKFLYLSVYETKI